MHREKEKVSLVRAIFFRAFFPLKIYSFLQLCRYIVCSDPLRSVCVFRTVWTCTTYLLHFSFFLFLFFTRNRIRERVEEEEEEGGDEVSIVFSSDFYSTLYRKRMLSSSSDQENFPRFFFLPVELWERSPRREGKIYFSSAPPLIRENDPSRFISVKLAKFSLARWNWREERGRKPDWIPQFHRARNESKVRWISIQMFEQIIR